MFWVYIFTVLTAGVSAHLDFTVPVVNGGRSNSTAMILPLFFKDRDPQGSGSRRHLSGTNPNARMPLHDDLLLNGYYTTRLWIGTPPQRFALIVDTGSTVTYVPCSTCHQCGNHQDPKFQPDQSSTYQPVKCNVDCTCDSDGKQCTYERQYAEMSSSSGVLGEDIVSFGTLSELNPKRAIFGCENMETGDLYSQHADGIMGLGRGDLSIVDQLVVKGVINDSFSLCYGGMGVGGGAMVLGGISPPADMIFAHSDPARSPYYNIDLREIYVAGKVLPLNPRVFDAKHGTVLDSGTTYAYLPKAAFLAFKEAIMEELHSLQIVAGPDPNYKDICFSGAGSDVSKLSSIFPSVEMAFGNGQKLMLSPENYLFRVPFKGFWCILPWDFPKWEGSNYTFGGIIVRNTLVTYDREHESIGFWKTNCSELWERLQLPTPPSPIPDENKNDSSTSDAPMPLPSEPPLPQTPVSGDSKIGDVAFSILLNMTYSDLKPQISEFIQLIVNGLNVDASQVKLVGFSSEENGTLTEWAIFPAKPDKYMSDATAMDIISKLEKDQLNLATSFGSHKIFGWKTQPPSKWIGLHKFYVVAIFAFLVVVVLALSASVAWIVWRRKHSLTAYKPVDSVVAEQELQPLQT